MTMGSILGETVDRVDFLEEALRRIVDRSQNGELGTSKVMDMRRIAEAALEGRVHRLPVIADDDQEKS